MAVPRKKIFALMPLILFILVVFALHVGDDDCDRAVRKLKEKNIEFIADAEHDGVGMNWTPLYCERTNGNKTWIFLGGIFRIK